MAQQRGYEHTLLLDLEDNFGVLNAVGVGKTLPFVSWDVVNTKELIPSDLITGDRSPSEPIPGLFKVTGSAVVPFDYEDLGWWLTLALGAPVTTGAGPFTHTFKSEGNLGSSNIELAHDTLTQFNQFLGMKINQLSMDINPSETGLNVDIDLIGSNSAFDVTSIDATPVASAFNRAVTTEITVMEEGGGALANGTGLQFSINNNLDDSQYTLNGGGAIGAMPEGKAVIEGTLTTLFEDLTVLNKARNVTESSLKVTFTSGASSMEILFPELQYTFQTPTVSGNEGLLVEAPFTSYFDNAAEASAIQITLINNTTAYT